MNLFLAADLLAPKAGLAFWIALIFLTMLFLLKRYAWGPITNALTEREQSIEDSLQRAEKALAEARQLQADNEKARREAEVDAQRILREAREAADAARAEGLDRERRQIAQLQKQFQEEMQRETAQIRGELRAEVADLAIQAAEKILRENLDTNRQQKLVNDFIATLPSN